MLSTALLLLVTHAAATCVPRPKAYASTADGKYKISPYSAPVLGPGSPGNSSTWDLSIDDTPSGYKQKVTGFGAALTETTVDVFDKLPADQLAQLLKELMTSEGNNFAIMRHTIGSSDLSPEPAMSYDDNGGNAGVVDPSLAHFDIGSRGLAMAAMLKSMKELNPNMVTLGSCWGPPGWMQNDHILVGAGINTLNHSYSEQYGEYFVKYIQAFEAAGAHIDAITIQNEPLNNNSGMPSLVIEPAESGQLIHDFVGPALRHAGLETEIWAYDHNTDRPDYPQTVFDMAPEYVNTAAWHCYANPIDWTVLTEFYHNNSHVEGFKQFHTECWTSNIYTGWNQAADFTMGPMQNWAMGSLAWTLATDTNDGPCLDTPGACCTCTGLVVVDTAAGTYNFTTDYYMMGQFSKFMPQGATVLEGTGSYTYSSGGGVESVASLNPDGTRSVVIENKFGNPIYITLTTKGGETWSGLVEAESVTTWVLPPILSAI
ncbi:putative beta-1,6-glucanase Neg1 [Coniochaeta ligniaria NRRL 30616]|uniref:Putative beta-1,6-glucanase Neg1 n=1 Tax=Coniochaeta ligniaria NRRL 30616 TaxID=1408157 RepID=A0A1J7JST3_9PEZI|nr:putative beta-1,6-glucanase Neg1 [Coniochaeta ligniaria NRRL 30616]